MERNLIEESTYDGIFYAGTWFEKLRLREFEESNQIPVGLDYLEMTTEHMLSCQESTAQAIEQCDQSIKENLCSIGTVLSLLERAASCFWGCQRGDHTFEYLTGRVVGYSQTILLLSKTGRYDEAISLIRGIAEIANLFTLFVNEPTSFNDWRTFPENKRRPKFSPVKVRERLELLNVLPPCDSNRYSWLCEVAVHATPHTKPQMYQPNARPSAGAIFQEDGFKKVINELSLALAAVSFAVVELAKLEDSKRSEIAEHAKILLSFA